jgi:hypothetical protein
MLKIGIDELATEQQVLAGYAYFLLRDTEYVDFQREHSSLCTKYSITGFHGKKYRSTEAQAYKDFLKLIKKYLEISPISLFCMTLNTGPLDDELNDFFKNIFIESIRPTAAFSDEEFIVLNSFTSYLLTLQRITNHMKLDKELAEIEIDSDQIKKKLADIKIEIKGKVFTGEWFVKTFYNKYRRQLFPSSPEITKAINVRDDQKSAIIQAADVFANFLLSHIFIQKGHPSTKRQEKSDILTSIFGPAVDLGPADLAKIVRVGKNDLELTLSGAVTYHYGKQ